MNKVKHRKNGRKTRTRADQKRINRKLLMKRNIRRSIEEHIAWHGIGLLGNLIQRVGEKTVKRVEEGKQ